MLSEDIKHNGIHTEIKNHPQNNPVEDHVVETKSAGAISPPNKALQAEINIEINNPKIHGEMVHEKVSGLKSRLHSKKETAESFLTDLIKKNTTEDRIVKKIESIDGIIGSLVSKLFIPGMLEQKHDQPPKA